MIIKSVKRSKIVSNALYHVIITAFSFAMIYPLLWMIGSSFKFNEEIFVNVRRILPTKWTITNYTTGWAGFGGNSFALFFKNSFFVTILVTIGTVLSSSFIAFGFARIRFRGRSFWFVMMIITMLLPGQVMIIPRYVMFNNMGWVGTFLPLTVPAFFGSAFDIFLVMQFVRGIPRDMDEAATIDGAGRFARIWHITLPGIRGIISIQLILTVSKILNVSFNQIFVLISDLTLDVGETIDYYVYRVGLGSTNNMSLATASGMFKSVIGLVLIVVTNYISHKLTDGEGIW